ncbi:MAG: alpha/beta hydrolase [Gammaproteobacteria bacterium]
MVLRCSRWFLVLLIALVAGCRAPVYLMPTPEVMQDARFDVFADNPYLQDLDTITTYFATTRKPAKAGDRKVFSKHHGGAVRMGQATFRIGDEGDAWRALYTESMTVDERDRVELSLIDTAIEASADLEQWSDTPTDDVREFFAGLNREIDASPTQILTVFVHGANNSFYESVARGAQLQYFTGKSDVALTYAWPSAGSIWGYSHDKKQANRSIGDFARFLKLLALHSTAKHINVIAYSSGGRIVGGALTKLGRDYPADDKRLDASKARRVNQVYMAASDEPLQAFAENYPGYAHIVDTITVTANPDDAVLGLAKLADGEVRLGSVGGGQNVENLTDDERERLRELINSDKLNFIDMQIDDIKGFEYSHGAWYENPWLSTDVLVTLYIGIDPETRGLQSYQTAQDVKVWYFPKDYLSALKATLLDIYD